MLTSELYATVLEIPNDAYRVYDTQLRPDWLYNTQ